MDSLKLVELKKLYKEYKKKGLIKKNLTGLNKKEILDEIKKCNIQGEGLKDIIKSVKDYLFFPSSKMPKKSQEILNKYKNENIKSIKVYREPIQSSIQSFLNLVSLGKFNEAKKNANFDDLFHLYAIFTLDSGKEILIEKNENIYIRDDFTKSKDNENIDIDISRFTTDKRLDLDTILYNTEKLMGKFYFYQYNAKSNNCQDFIINILKANGLDNKKYIDFIKQDVEVLFQNLPSWSNKFTQVFTDFRAKINEIFGLGVKRKLR
jgi:hypothetical protein